MRESSARDGGRVAGVLILSLLAMGGSAGAQDAAAFDSAPRVVTLSGNIDGIHDPSIAKDRDTYYVFSTRSGPASEGVVPIHCSKDLHAWKACCAVFKDVPHWIKERGPK